MKIIVNNLAMEYRDEGNGPIMLFLHGWQDNLHTFDRLAHTLKDEYRIIRVDLPGFGASEMPQSVWNLDDYVRFIADFIDKLRISPDIIVGHSFGGRIAIKAIVTKAIHPQKTVLIASAGITKIHTPRNLFFKMCVKVGKVITLIPPFFFWRDQIRKKLYQVIGSDYGEAGALRDTFLNIIREDLSSAAAAIDIPTLLIWGNDDIETPIGDGRRLTEMIHGSRLEIIPHAGHFVHQQYPEQVSKLIQDFIISGIHPRSSAARMNASPERAKRTEEITPTWSSDFRTPYSVRNTAQQALRVGYFMMKSWFSHYHPRYVRSLIYMLQQSEYDIRDYLHWYHRAKDMSRVEHRKQLVKTPKVLLLFVIAWGMLMSILTISFIFIFWHDYGAPPLRFVMFGIALLVAPRLLAYAMIVPVVFIQIAQKPIEYILILRAKKKLNSHKAFKIAVAGSFGKTSMREILKTVLGIEKKVAAPPHSYNTPLAIGKFINGLKGDEEILIFELGEYYPGDVRKLCELIRPDLGIITGVNEAHLQKFKTLERTTHTIFELSDFLGTKPLYINGENEVTRLHALPEHIVYTRKGAGKKKVMQPHTDLMGTSCILFDNGREMKVASSLLGLHQIGPLAAAADIAERLGISSDAIQKGLNNTKPFDHRLEPKTDTHGVITLDDSYNGNPDGVKAVIEFFSSLKGYRRIYVTPGLVEMGSRTQEVHREIGRELALAGIEHVILIKNSVTPFIDQGLKESEYRGEITWFDDGLCALTALPHLTVAGDVVLLQNDWPDQYA